MKDIHEVKLEDIMPSSLTGDQNVLDTARSLDEEMRLVTGATREALILPRLDELDERIIDMLAWEYHVDFYELADTPEKKRNLVRDTIMWHMKKGTKYAIVKSLENLGIDAEYSNWYEYGGQPYCFRVKAHVKAEYYERTSDYEALVANIRRAVEDSKAARSWLESLYVDMNFRDKIRHTHGIGELKSGYHYMRVSHAKTPGPVKHYHGMASLLSGERYVGISRPCEKIGMKIGHGCVLQELNLITIRLAAQEWTEQDKRSVRE